METQEVIKVLNSSIKTFDRRNNEINFKAKPNSYRQPDTIFNRK